MNEQAVSPAKIKIKLSPTVKLALLVFLLASSLVLALFPLFAHKSSNSSPSFIYLLAAGLIVVALNCGLFWYLSRLNLGFGRTALVLAAGYNSIIAIIKLVFSPFALYQSDQQNAFNTNFGDPNSAIFYFFVAIFILLLYIGVFSLIYRYFKHRLHKAQNPNEVVAKRPLRKVRAIGFLVVAIILIALLGGGFWILPLLAAAPTLSYLGYIFGAFALPLAVALGLAAYLAYRGFSAVEKEAISTGNATLLAGFFWIGLSLIFLYHILWIVLMVTLIQIWPFQTYTPK